MLKLTVKTSQQPTCAYMCIRYSHGMIIRVKKAGTASPRYFQLISTTFLIMSDPEMTKAPPVAQAGILAKIGAKKTEMKKQSPAAIPVRPVFPPSEIPVALSMKAVTGDVPNNAPIEMEKASMQ
jgi:hypothetical protein